MVQVVTQKQAKLLNNLLIISFAPDDERFMIESSVAMALVASQYQALISWDVMPTLRNLHITNNKFIAAYLIAKSSFESSLFVFGRATERNDAYHLNMILQSLQRDSMGDLPASLQFEALIPPNRYGTLEAIADDDGISYTHYIKTCLADTILGTVLLQ
jgi:hypothetical protein